MRENGAENTGVRASTTQRGIERETEKKKERTKD